MQEDAQKNDPNAKEVKESDIQLIQASKVNEDSNLIHILFSHQIFVWWETDLFSSIFDS